MFSQYLTRNVLVNLKTNAREPLDFYTLNDLLVFIPIYIYSYSFLESFINILYANMTFYVLSLSQIFK